MHAIAAESMILRAIRLKSCDLSHTGLSDRPGELASFKREVSPG